MKNVKQLRDERAEKIEALEALNDKITAEKRNLKPEEKREFDSLEADIKEIDKNIKRAEQHEKSLSDEVGKINGGSEYIDVRTGNPIPALTRSHKLADVWQPKNEEEKDLSLGKLIRGLTTGNWDGAEREYRALSTTIGTAGGFAVPSSMYAKIIDLARAKSVVMQAGARLFPMETQKVTIAKLASDPTPEFKAENAAFNYSDVTFEGMELNAKTMGVICSMSRELVEDSIGVDQAVTNAIAQAIAQKVDHVALFGTGGTEPTGLLNTANVQELETVGVITDYEEFVTAWAQILAANGEPNAYIISPREAGKLQLIKGTDGQYLSAPQAIANMQRFITSKVPTNGGAGTNESMAIMGDFSNLLMGIRKGLLIETSTEANGAFEKHQLHIKGTIRFDIGVLRPEHFVQMTGITA